MKRFTELAAATVVVAALCGPAGAQRTAEATQHETPRMRIDAPASDRLAGADGAVPAFGATASQSTTWLASYTFDSGPNCVNEGWTSVDRTIPGYEFFHVDDFAGLGGGRLGLLVPLEGTRSMWCGARPDPVDIVVCGYATLPGYGNDWNQALCSATCLSVTSDVVISFSLAYSTEPHYDATWLEIDHCDDAWQEIAGGFGSWDGAGTDTVSIAVADSLHEGALRFRFHFLSDGVYSDQDGRWDSDGAVIVDELSVTDSTGVVVDFEDFEDEAVGDNDADDWVSCSPPGYGDFAALYRGLYIVQEDPCRHKLDCVWTFYTGSTYDYACGGWPIQKVVPYVNAREQYIFNEVWSPEIAVAGAGSAWELRFDVYRDLPLSPLVFYVWHVTSVVDGCAKSWDDYNFVYYGAGKDWLRSTSSFGQLVSPGATHIRVALGVRDMCNYWGGIYYGDCLCHSHAPLFDDVEVYRIAAGGPQWQVRDIDLFQDTFSGDGTITGTARADAALDILPSTSAGILPGDSVSVTVGDPENGIDFHTPGDPSSGPAVYCFVRVDGVHESAPGAALVDDPRYDVVGTVSVNGRAWTQIQMDSCYTSEGGVVADDYNVDLNDNLFVPGDTVWFFFGARSAPPSGAWTYFSMPVRTVTAQTGDMMQAAIAADEFTVLPTEPYDPWRDPILYVDGMNFRGREELLYNGYPDYQGVQLFWETAFNALGLWGCVDRFDIRGPSSAVGNHPGARVKNLYQQIVPVYRQILWDCGDFTTSFGDGTGTPDKSDDAGLLYSFLSGLEPTSGGVYLCGDDVAHEWLNTLSGASAAMLRSTFMNFDVVSDTHVPSVGVNPLGIGVPAGIFRNAFGPDTLVVFGGCPIINDFDVLAPLGTARVEMEYHGNGNTSGAVLSQATTNGQGNTVGFLLSGFGYSYVRDFQPMGTATRFIHLERILRWLGVIIDMYVDTPVQGPASSLDQNYPNPFNPVTTITYSIAARGHVALEVYNVAGQLVRTLVDEVQSPESVRPVRWDGANDRGQAVASGVYFYRLVTKDFARTRKMVLLK